MKISPTGRTGPTSVVDATGILGSRYLPDNDFNALWDAIIVESAVKDQLLSQAILNFTLRPQINRAEIPLHGIMLLVGAPGTGKTSLARGLASRVAAALNSPKPFVYLEVEPHALTGAALGKSQKAVTELLGGVVAESAANNPVIVLLDEVETLAADRSKMSLQANPIDVHRATDAVLAQMDQLADSYPNLLFLATSNFPEAIDQAFLSRADLIVTVDMPGPEACRKILIKAVEALSQAFPAVKAISSQADFDRAVKATQGLDGRRIRKLVASACTFSKETALDPSRLTATDLLHAAEQAQKETRVMKGGA